MSEPVNKRPVIVGIFIVLGLAFLIGGILTIGDMHSTFQKKMTVVTLFDDINGLQAGNNIWFSGVKVGTVKQVEFYGKSQVKVTMNINLESREYIRKDAKVKISTDGLIGNKILVIYGGTPSVPEIEEGDLLENEVILSVDEIMKTFEENNQNVLILTKKLAKGEGTIGKLISNDSIYNNIASTTKYLELASADARTLIASLANFSEKLNKKGSLANDLATDTTVFNSLRNSVVQIQGIADTANAFINNLNEASTNTKTPVGVMLHDEQAGADLKASINNLKSSSEKLDKDLEALQHSFLLKKYFKKEAEEKEEVK